MIIGKSGCGKTSLIAKTAATILETVKPRKNYSIILRFLGTSPMSSTISKTFVTIICQLKRLFKLENIEKEKLNQMNYIQLKEVLVDLFEKIKDKHPEQRIIIFLDSIDQLVKTDYCLDWMPTKYPSNVKFIYSYIEDFDDILNESLQKTLNDSSSEVEKN